MKENAKTYIADNFNLALKKVKADLGTQALILSHDTIDGKAHVVAMPELFSQEVKSDPHQNQKLFPDESQFSSVLLKTPEPKNQSGKRKVNQNQKLAQDVAYIKAILQNNVITIKNIGDQEKHHYLMRLKKNLSVKGFGKTVTNQILFGAFDCDSHESLSNRITENMEHLIRCNKMDFYSKRKVKAFIGPSGGGKTTFITKLMMHLFENKIEKNIAIILVNHSNIKVKEEAKVLGRIFNIPTYYVETAKELEIAYHQSYDKHNILVELPSPCSKNSENNFFFEFIYKFANDIDCNLVLPSMMTTSYIEQFINIFSHIKFEGLILTKTDENAHYETVLNASIHYQIPLRFINTGTSCEQPLIVATKEYFMHHFKNVYVASKNMKIEEKYLLKVNEEIA